MSKKVLFIEDQQGFQLAMTNFFKEKGYEAFSAYDGETGLKFAETEHPDIIFLDVIVPKKNGFDVLKELKSNAQLSSIPVIILTNLEGVQDVEKALSLGAVAYLVKASYSCEDLFEKAEEVLSKHEHTK